jgi:hypothetical protein
MKTYRVFWTYVGNYADVAMSIRAESHSDAIQRFINRSGFDNPDFNRKARFHVTSEDNDYRVYVNGECVKEGSTFIRSY